jgi:hypothetical protein
MVHFNRKIFALRAVFPVLDNNFSDLQARMASLSRRFVLKNVRNKQLLFATARAYSTQHGKLFWISDFLHFVRV